jgi:hypothetical protein
MTADDHAARFGVAPEHAHAIPELIVSSFADEAAAGLRGIAGRQRNFWLQGMQQMAAALAPVLEPGERVRAGGIGLRSVRTLALVLTLGFAGMYQRRCFLAVTDRRLLLLTRSRNPSKRVAIADPLAETELLSFGESLVRRDPSLVLRFADARGAPHRVSFQPAFQPEAKLIAELLSGPSAEA